MIEPGRLIAHCLNGAHSVADEDDRLARLFEVAELLITLLLEFGVTDREHLVDNQNVGSTLIAIEKPRRTYMPDE